MTRMRPNLLAAGIVLVACVAFGAGMDRNAVPSPILDRKMPPAVSLPDALRIAQEYVKTQKVDVSNHYLYS